MSRSANIENLNQCQDDNFMQELKLTSKNVNESNANKFFEILLHRISNHEVNNNNTQGILKTIYEIISTRDEIFQVFVDRNCIINLPYEDKIFNREILNILHIVVSKCPESIVSGREKNLFQDQFQDLIQYEGKKTLLLLCLYTERFDSLDENQSKILDLLVKKNCSDRFSSFDTARYYVLLLSAAVEKSESFRKNNIKKAWQIINQIIKDYNEYLNDNSDDDTDFIDIIGNCYIALDRIEPYYRTSDLDFDLLNSHLQIPEIQDKILYLLFFVPFQNQPIIENKEFIIKLLNFSTKPKYGWIIYILFDICTKSNTAIDYLCKEKSWQKVGHSFMVDTLRLFLIIKENLNIKTMTISKEFAMMIKSFFEEEQNRNNLYAPVKIIAVILFNIKLNDDVINELCKNNFIFFKNLINRAIERNNKYYLYCCALIAKAINDIGYNDVLLEFCPVLCTSVSTESNYFNNLCGICIILCQHDQIRNEFIKLNVQDILKEKLNNEKTKKYAKKFLNAVTSNKKKVKSSGSKV